MISVLIPVLGRPQNALPVVDSIRAHTTVEYEIIFLCSPRDDAQIAACAATDSIEVSTRVITVPWTSGPGDAARKWNRGYEASVFSFVFCAADDVEFTPGWDTEALRVAEQTGAGMIGTNDDANPLVRRGRHSTHSLFRRSYIDKIGGTFFDGPGVMYHEGYKHQYIDNEAVKAATDRREWAFAARSLVRHHHPMYDKTVAMDTTYKKALGDASEDAALYRSRLHQWSVSLRSGSK